MYSEQDPLSHFKRLQMGVFGFSQNETGVTSVAMANNIVGVVLFEEHCFNISGDILDSIFYYLSGTIYDIIAVLICITQKTVSEYL